MSQRGEIEDDFYYDDIGCMAGAIAACMYPIPDDIAEKCNEILSDDLREIKDRFIDFIEKRQTED